MTTLKFERAVWNGKRTSVVVPTCCAVKELICEVDAALGPSLPDIRTLVETAGSSFGMFAFRTEKRLAAECLGLDWTPKNVICAAACSHFGCQLDGPYSLIPKPNLQRH